jgi:hypothetical protein
MTAVVHGKAARTVAIPTLQAACVDLDAATTLCVWYQFCKICVILMVHVSIQGMCTFIKSPISRGRHGKEGEKGKEGCSDEEGRQEDERQEEEMTGATSLRAVYQSYRHLKRRCERC